MIHRNVLQVCSVRCRCEECKFPWRECQHFCHCREVEKGCRFCCCCFWWREKCCCCDDRRWRRLPRPLRRLLSSSLFEDMCYDVMFLGGNKLFGFRALDSIGIFIWLSDTRGGGSWACALVPNAAIGLPQPPEKACRVHTPRDGAINSEDCTSINQRDDIQQPYSITQQYERRKKKIPL